MRSLLVIVCTTISMSLFGQSAIDSKVSKDVCSCLSQCKKLSEAKYLMCFQQGVVNNKKVLEKECFLIYKDTSEETERKFGLALYDRISISMIYSCQAYSLFLDTIRYSALKGLNKDSINQVILKQNDIDSSMRNSKFYTERGIRYFQVGSLDSALNDFDSSIALDKNAFQSMYFKAWVLEIKNKYDQAYALYEEVATLTKKREIKLVAEIVKKKKNGL